MEPAAVLLLLDVGVEAVASSLGFNSSLRATGAASLADGVFTPAWVSALP